MLSGKLGGLAQVRPKLLFVAMLLATIVLVACGGDETEQPPETPTPATVPTATAGLPAPTPTVPSASATPTVQPGSATPQAIDTSDWLTYTSPLGFTLQYPPSWTVVGFDLVNIPERHVRIMNEKAKAEHDRRVGAHILSGDVRSGETWIEIVPDAFPEFDVDGIVESC